MTIHDSSYLGVTACCGRPYTEIPRGERITIDGDAVTCHGDPACICGYDWNTHHGSHLTGCPLRR